MFTNGNVQNGPKRNPEGFNTIIHEFNLRNVSPVIGYILSHNCLQNKVHLRVQKKYPRTHASTNNFKQISYLILKFLVFLNLMAFFFPTTSLIIALLPTLKRKAYLIPL